MLDQQSFGDWLKRKRKSLDLTREGLADRVGCSAATIRKLEAEERRPSAQIVERLAEIFDIPHNEHKAFLRFARGDWNSAPSETKEEFPWHNSTKTPRSNLPATTTSLIAREQEITGVHEYLLETDIRLVTLIGPPGIGKTRLSIESARIALPDFPDGIFFVALAPLDDPSLIPSTIVQTLGFVEAKNQPASQQLMDGIGNKQLLLVLDNCEHLIVDVALFASELLSACSRLKILTTSREALRIPGEWLFPVPALGVPFDSSSVDIDTFSEFPALVLFSERARAVRPDFELNAENIKTVASICNQLDGLPLAIELIAARIRILSPEPLLARLNDRFVLSADGMRAVSARQKTLNQAIDWSYDLLSSEEQQLFAFLSVFSGGFTLEAVEAIFSRKLQEKSASDLVLSLLDKSLLQRTFDRKVPNEPRFNMLVTVQQFALGRLRSTGRKAEIRDWHLTYFLDFAEQAEVEIHGPDQVEWMDRLEKEYDNFRAALEWCVSGQKTEIALRLLGALGWAWHVRGHYREIRSWFEQIRSLPGVDTHPALFARLLFHIGRQSWLLGEFNEARSVLNESRKIWQQLGPEGERSLAGALVFLGMTARSSEGDNKTAQSLFEQSLELYRKHGDQRGIAFATFNLGWIADDRDEDMQALSLFEQSLNLYRQVGDLWGMGRASQLLGQFFLKQGNFEKARLYFEQHLMLDESIQFKEGNVIALSNLGHLYRRQGDFDQAEKYYEKSLSMCQEYSLKIDRGYNLYSFGILALHRNNYTRAQQLFTEYFKSSYQFGEKIITSDFLNGAAAIAAGTDNPECAARLHGAAQALLETIDYRIPPFDLAEFDRHIRLAREQLGDTRFEAFAAEGYDMTMEQAIAYALEKSDD